MNVKHHEKIAERNRDNHALYIDEWDYPRAGSKAVISAAPDCPPDSWFREVIRESKERLSREKVLVYKLDEPQARGSLVGFLTKGEAAETLRVFEFELLDLERFGGMLVRADHLFISDTKAVHLRDQGSGAAAQ